MGRKKVKLGGGGYRRRSQSERWKRESREGLEAEGKIGKGDAQ